MAKPLTLVMNRNFTLNTRMGHSIEFIKGKPTVVSPIVYQEAMAAGAVPPEGEEVVNDEKPEHVAPQDPIERNPLIAKAILDIVETNQRDDFTAAGSPTVGAVSKLVGFTVRASEIAAMWQAYHDKQAEEKIAADKEAAKA